MARYLGTDRLNALKLPCVGPAASDVLTADSSNAGVGAWGKLHNENIDPTRALVKREAVWPDGRINLESGTDGFIGQIPASLIRDNSIDVTKISALDYFFFGTGRDGVVDLDGTKTYPGVTISGVNTYDLQQDLVASTITIRANVTLRTFDGLKLLAFRVFARDLLRLEGNAVIHADGLNGNAGTRGIGTTKGTGGVAPGGIPSFGTISGPFGNGANGGLGGALNGGGSLPTSTTQPSAARTIGGFGGAGTKGGNGVGVGANGQPGALATSGLSNTMITIPEMTAMLDANNGTPVAIVGGGCGGAGGGGGGGSVDAGCGGSSYTPSGGIVLVAAGTWDLTTWTGRISANGGQGASANNVGSSGGGGGNGGGAGGGGVCLCGRIFNGPALTTDAATLNPGTNVANLQVYAGAGGSTTTNQSTVAGNGSAGRVFTIFMKMNISTRTQLPLGRRIIRSIARNSSRLLFKF